ncbi:protein of unknown function [Arachidicoccus rhizosphaerae]|uniref:Ferritin-like metal-binding protein YciE n=1 Tax=Arachidicoccus rhizosphaerae TaxID=551991 RepID=A0A1H3YXZ5_9BACT|nr:DUF892 family protein [Arachidicoccus rhizosphaerae]SEA16453.1 protein of unknown function [Arachidicoccus rhizosphaerae]
MNKQGENEINGDKRSKNEQLFKCGQLLERQIIRLWWLETDCQVFLQFCEAKIETGRLGSLVHQLLLGAEYNIRRLRKMCEVLSIEPLYFQFDFKEEIVQLMQFSKLALHDFVIEEMVSHWNLTLALQCLIHYKLVYYESMAGWCKYLKLLGIQELLEDSLDEYLHLDLMLKLLTESWE